MQSLERQQYSTDVSKNKIVVLEDLGVSERKAAGTLLQGDPPEFLISPSASGKLKLPINTYKPCTA